MANKDKIIDKIEKKIDSIEKLHDKENKQRLSNKPSSHSQGKSGS